MRAELTVAERDELQAAYNGICGVIARLRAAGWDAGAIYDDAERVRASLAKMAFDA